MNILLLIQTVRYLRPTQVAYQLKYRLCRPRLREEALPEMTHNVAMLTQPIVKSQCYDGKDEFSFLNIASTFQHWNMGEHGPLWSYNLNYMDWLEQEDISTDECLRWIDMFIDELPGNHVGLDAYPTALRVINWAKFFSKHPECRSKKRLDSMYAQTRLLERKLEYHLLGNHLLEDAYSLFIAAIFFTDQRLFHKAETLLLRQLNEQTLPDGAHYEQSAMYHCIMLDRLLDCINFAKGASQFSPLTPHLSSVISHLSFSAALMLGHLASIIYKDGSIPLFNDSAIGIAPSSEQIFDYARRLDITWEAIPLRECGYRRLYHGPIEATVDVGNIMASYQPGHSHADTFSYELRIDGKPFIVDTGISTYNKNERRQYERSTAAHNTVTVLGQDSSEVWGGFRMGRRAAVTLLKDQNNEVEAWHDGFGRNAVHQRRVFLDGTNFRVEDRVPSPAVSYLHLSPGLLPEIISEKDGLIKVGHITIKVENAQQVEILKNTVSAEYNRLQPCHVIALHFTRSLSYIISIGISYTG